MLGFSVWKEGLISFLSNESKIVYGIRSRDISKIQSKKNWINFEKYVESIITPDFIKKIQYGSVLKNQNFIDNNGYLLYNIQNIVSKLDSKSMFVEFASNFIGVNHVNITYETFNIVNKFCSMNMNYMENSDIETMAKKVCAKYPMLYTIREIQPSYSSYHIERYFSDDEVENFIVDYVKSVDERMN
jgi:hypothetical protein